MGERNTTTSKKTKIELVVIQPNGERWVSRTAFEMPTVFHDWKLVYEIAAKRLMAPIIKLLEQEDFDG